MVKAGPIAGRDSTNSLSAAAHRGANRANASMITAAARPPWSPLLAICGCSLLSILPNETAVTKEAQRAIVGEVCQGVAAADFVSRRAVSSYTPARLRS